MSLRRATGKWWIVLDAVDQAVSSLGDRPLRSVLSVLGIAVGIVAVTLIGTVSRGGREVIFAELQTFGLRSVWVVRDHQITDPWRAVRAGTGITNDDYEVLGASGCCPAVARMTPIVHAQNNGSAQPLLARAGGRYAQPRIEGVGSDYVEIGDDVIRLGRNFNATDIARRRSVVIIGSQVHEKLFGGQDAVGKELMVGDARLEVIGVLAGKDRSFLSSIGSGGGQDVNNRILLPYTRLQQMDGRKEIDMLQAQAVDQHQAAAAAAQISALLTQRHRAAFNYRTETMARYVETANRILSGVSIIGVVAASVSLFVAGLGILNIMSTSVLERTREIGLRKAIGGTSAEILQQFLLEAVLISLIGGTIGLALGILGSGVLAKLAKFPFSVPIPLILLAIGVAVAVGLLSGFYPAYRAAKLRPVQTLRYE